MNGKGFISFTSMALVMILVLIMVFLFFTLFKYHLTLLVVDTYDFNKYRDVPLLLYDSTISRSNGQNGCDIVDGCKVDMIFELNTLNLIPNSDKSTVKNQILDKIDSFIGDNFLSLVLSTVNTNNILCVYGFVIQTSCVNVLPAYQLGVVYPLSILYKPGSGLLTDLIWQVK